MTPDSPSLEGPSTASDSPTRKRILECALSAIRAESWDAISVSRITRDAGVAKGTFFLHFPSKEHLLTWVLEDFFAGALKFDRDEKWVGPDGIVRFSDALTQEFRQRDPVVGAALLMRLASLPPSTESDAAPRMKILEWVRARLGEALPIALPLEEIDSADLAFLLVAALENTLADAARAGEDPARTRRRLGARLLFLLRSAGLAADPPPSE